MKQVPFGDLLDKAYAREHQPVDVDESLRTTGWLSMASFAIGLLLYNYLPLPEKVVTSRFFLVMDQWLAWMITQIKNHQVEIFHVIGYSLGLAVFLLFITRWFTHARLIYQWLVYGISVIGAVNAFFMAGMASIVVINLMIWALAVGLVLTIVGLILYGVYARVILGEA